MTLFRWVIRSLVHYRRMHIAVALAAATATATLTGALLVGDSVKATLKYSFDTRLGSVEWVVSTKERFFIDDLSERLKKENIDTAPVVELQGMVTKGDGSIRVNHVRVLGVDDRFFNMSLAGKAPAGMGDGTTLINTALASRLNIKKESNTEVVLRFDNPSLISRNLVLAPYKESTISMRISVTGVVDDEHFGRFSLEANQKKPYNIFVPITWLQKQIKHNKQANLLLISDATNKLNADLLNKAVSRVWRFPDAGAELIARGENTLELRSSRVFLDRSFGDAAKKVQPSVSRFLTYFVNELRVGDAVTPYSMVTAAERKGDFVNILPPDMEDDEIVINQWLADDLNAKPGDELTLTYYIPGEWQNLEEINRSFKICRVIAIDGAASDPNLAPDIPGLSDSENCSEWDSSLPIDLNSIRDKDEKYWDNYKGTPKAFITLFVGKTMWSNSYGDLTGIRFQKDILSHASMAEELTKLIDPRSLGMSVIPVKEIGMRASTGGTDFGELFMGLSIFLIISGILLIWLLFVFSIEGRKTQTGMLIGIGFPLKQIRKVYLFEGLFIALIGSMAGIFISLIYTRLVILGLSTAWQGAVAGMDVHYSVSLTSVIAGFISGFLIACIAMIWTLHRQMKISAHGLLSMNESPAINNPVNGNPINYGFMPSMISFISAFLLLFFSKDLVGISMAAAFFIAGALLLFTVISLISMLLAWMGKKYRGSIQTLFSVALRNSARRRGRSMAVITMLACGVFIVIAVGANRKDPGAGADLRESGTGGFTLYAESSVPVVQTLDKAKGRSVFGIDPSLMHRTEVIGLRVHDGDDASCLNLNRAQEPRILGVSTYRMNDLKAFSFQDLENMSYKNNPWSILRQDYGTRVIPAFGDYPTINWGLGKKIGDTLIYHNRKGEEIRLRIVGIMNRSILQGSLIISEYAMARYFPEIEGYRAWLIDTPSEKTVEVSKHLTERMADVGLSVENTVDRLELFGRMEDTYLSIFLILGGLGLILGCIGLGLIVARNLIERKGELAMLRAVGFNRRTIMKIVCYEHIYLLLAGIITGLICAVISVIPTIKAASGHVPVGLLSTVILLIVVSGILWVLISTWYSSRGDILTPLRNE
jgi:putative ABC transport system permease protein